MAGAATSSTKIGSPSLYYVLITLTNSQASPTPDNFQQLISVNFRRYQSYLASDVGNIRFFNSSNFSVQNELPAWLENYTGASASVNSATSSIIWIRLAGTTIPAESQITIFMAFEPGVTEFDALYWGEAPTLSGNYAQYDNGVQVFSFYDNFAGTMISSAWNVASATGTWSVNNGLTVSSSSFPGLVLSLNAQYTGPLVVDAYQVGTYGDWSGLSFSNLQTTSTSFAITSGVIQYVYPTEGAYGYHGICVSSGCTDFTPNPSSTTLQVVSLALNSTTATEYQNYASPTSIASTFSLTNYPGIVQIAYSGSDTQTTYWFRVRAYPPDNVMPAAVFGSIL